MTVECVALLTCLLCGVPYREDSPPAVESDAHTPLQPAMPPSCGDHVTSKDHQEMQEPKPDTAHVLPGSLPVGATPKGRGKQCEPDSCPVGATPRGRGKQGGPQQRTLLGFARTRPSPRTHPSSLVSEAAVPVPPPQLTSLDLPCKPLTGVEEFQIRLCKHLTTPACPLRTTVARGVASELMKKTMGKLGGTPGT